MNKSIWAAAVVSALFAGALAVRADDAPAKEPATKPSVKLFAPYSKLTDLSEDQSAKIEEIHKKFLADRKALEEKQTADIDALLTDAQKTELTKASMEKKTMQSEKNAKKKADEAAN